MDYVAINLTRDCKTKSIFYYGKTFTELQYSKVTLSL